MRSKKKEQAYLKARAKGENKTQAAKKARIGRTTAWRAEKDPRVRSEMAAALEKAGVTKEKIAKTVLAALDANKVISANVIAKSGDGMADANSMTKDFVEVEDHPTRLKASELAGKFRGDFIERQEVEHSGSVALAVEVVDYAKAVKPKNGGS